MLNISQVANQPLVTITATWTDPPPPAPLGWLVVSRTIDFYAGSSATGASLFTAADTTLSSPAQLIVPLPAGPVTAKLTVGYAAPPLPPQTKTDTSNTITITLPTGGGGGGPLPAGVVPVLPLDTDLASYSTALASATRLAARAAGPATKFRSAYLRKHAVELTEQARSIEAEISELQRLDLEKMSVAQLVALPAISSALTGISGATTSLPATPNLAGPVVRLGAALRDFVLLEQILDWLARTDILDFWYGLFEALIDDVSRADSGLTSTKSYLSSTFQSSFSSQVEDLYQRVSTEVRHELDSLEGSVRSALAAATGTVTQEMRQLYASIDAPLLAGPPVGVLAQEPTEDDVFDPNPLAQALTQLDTAVDAQIAALRKAATDAIDNLSLQPAEQLFVSLMVTYVSLPVLAAVGIAVAGGPVSAGLLAAAVMIGGQELLHLVAKWLGGPISEQIDGLRGRIDAARRDLTNVIAATVSTLSASFVGFSGAADQLRLSGMFLRELSHLVPDVFLSGTADFLGRKRDELLRGASELALAAELAQGFEQATVFDVVRPSYLTLAAGRIPEAPQLPGGATRTRHVAETLLADLQRLEEQRLDLLDGRETRITKRISLSKLASTAGVALGIPLGTATTGLFSRLLAGESVAVQLDEGDLLDGTHPGFYRALIDDVRLFAEVAAGTTPAAEVPVHITHGGVSRTRVRRPGGASEGLSEQALRLLFSPAVCEAAYRRAITAAVRIRTLSGFGSFTWNKALGFPLWDEIRRAAATNELPDVGGLKRDFDPVLWNTGVPYLADPELRDPAQLRIALFNQDIFIIARAFGSNPLGSFPPSLGDATNVALTDAQIAAGAAAMSALLISTFRNLPSNPIRAFQKWGSEVRLIEEIEPALRDLGYLTLERLHEPQAIAAQLLAPLTSTATSTTLDIFTTATVGADGTFPPEQRRPLENVGLTTTLVVQLPGAIGDVSGLYSATGTTPPQLKDVVLEIDVRACYDAELEAVVRAARRRAAKSNELVALGGRGPVALPGQIAATDVAPLPRRVLQISLRAHRNRTLIAWKEARQVIADRSLTDFTPADKITVAQVDPLRFLTESPPIQPLDFLGQTKLTVSFANAAPGDLAALATQLTLDPAQLGIGDGLFALFPNLTTGVTGALHAWGITVVPMGPMQPWGGGTVTAGSLLASLVPAPSPWILRGTRVTSGLQDVQGTTSPIPLVDLYAGGAKSALDIDIGTLLPGRDWPAGSRPDPVYDVILTFVYSPPAVRLSPATSVLL